MRKCLLPLWETNGLSSVNPVVDGGILLLQQSFKRENWINHHPFFPRNGVSSLCTARPWNQLRGRDELRQTVCSPKKVRVAGWDI